jgi:hypothetical protein
MTESYSETNIIPVDVFPEKIGEIVRGIATSAIILSLKLSRDIEDILEASDESLRLSQLRNPLSYADLERLTDKLIDGLVPVDS